MEITEYSQKVEQITASLFEMMGVKVTVQVDVLISEDKKYLDVKVHTDENSGELIGRHGNKMDALATVINMMMPANEEIYGVLLDINNHRVERIRDVQELARQAAEQAVSTGQSVILDPMKPWERRVVHLELKPRTDIITTSEGEGEDRRVAISPAGVI